MKYADTARKVLGLTDLELYVQTNNGMNMRLFEGKLDTYNEKSYFGIAVRGLYEGKMGFAYAKRWTTSTNCSKRLSKTPKPIDDRKEFIYDGSGTYETSKKK